MVKEELSDNHGWGEVYAVLEPSIKVLAMYASRSASAALKIHRLDGVSIGLVGCRKSEKFLLHCFQIRGVKTPTSHSQRYIVKRRRIGSRY